MVWARDPVGIKEGLSWGDNRCDFFSLEVASTGPPAELAVERQGKEEHFPGFRCEQIVVLLLHWDKEWFGIRSGLEWEIKRSVVDTLSI